jgi:type II secretory pathway component GspD/PulD (secretin)
MLNRLIRLSVLTLALCLAGPGLLAQAPVQFRNFRDASMFELIDVVARRLNLNYTIDPAVPDGTVTINTYGELGEEHLFPLLESILRMNGAAAVKVGEVYHIVPLQGVAQAPISPVVSGEGASCPKASRPCSASCVSTTWALVTWRRCWSRFSVVAASTRSCRRPIRS